MNWSAAFTDFPPFKLPDRRTLKTLADCRAYILDLNEHEQAEPRWHAATAVLLQAAEHGGPFVMIARIAVSRALHDVQGVGPQPPPRATPQEKWKAKRAKRSPT